MKARTDIYTGIQGTGGIGKDQWTKTLMEDSREYWIKDSVILRTAIPPRHQFILELAWLNPAEYNSPYNK